MDIANRTVLLLGGSGLVGMAVARELTPFSPKAIIVSGLTRAEAETAVAELQEDPAFREITVRAEWGDIFVAEEIKDRPRREVLADANARGRMLDDIFGDLTDDAVERSALGALLLRWRPEIVVDCVNTATAFAYQNVFDSAARLRCPWVCG